VLGGNEDVRVPASLAQRAFGPNEAKAAFRAAKRADDMLVVAILFRFTS
jgi:hypothetical protein